MNKIFTLFFILAVSCQPDEIIVIKSGRNILQHQNNQSTIVADESKDCPPCEGNTYCNRKTGKCEAQAVSPVKRNETIANKPVSATAYYWQDKGGVDPQRVQ